MEIRTLDYGEYKGFQLDCHYVTRAYRHIQIKEQKGIKISIKRKRMKKTTKGFTSELYENYIQNGLAYGVFERKKLVGVIEGSLEIWHHVYRIWNIWVDAKYRKEGYGSALIKYAEEVALNQGARAMILEVQSCNDIAIRFYEKHGFHLVGFNTLDYTNDDIKRKEVRLEYGKRLPQFNQSIDEKV